MNKFLCATAVLLSMAGWAPAAAAEPGNPAAPIPVPGGTPNYAATAAQPPFGLSPAPPRGARISASVDSGYTARIGAGTTAGQLEDPRGITQGVAP